MSQSQFQESFFRKFALGLRLLNFWPWWLNRMACNVDDRGRWSEVAGDKEQREEEAHGHGGGRGLQVREAGEEGTAEPDPEVPVARQCQPIGHQRQVWERSADRHGGEAACAQAQDGGGYHKLRTTAGSFLLLPFHSSVLCFVIAF